MEKKILLERAAKILDANEKAKEVHFASDGTPFLRDTEANIYAKKLEDKAVVTIAKAELANTAQPEVKQPEGKPEAKPLTKMNVEELKAEIAKREGLTVGEKATKKEMVEAIEAFDAKATEPAKPEAETPEAENAAGGDADANAE